MCGDLPLRVNPHVGPRGALLSIVRMVTIVSEASHPGHLGLQPVALNSPS